MPLRTVKTSTQLRSWTRAGWSTRIRSSSSGGAWGPRPTWGRLSRPISHTPTTTFSLPSGVCPCCSTEAEHKRNPSPKNHLFFCLSSLYIKRGHSRFTTDICPVPRPSDQFHNEDYAIVIYSKYVFYFCPIYALKFIIIRARFHIRVLHHARYQYHSYPYNNTRSSWSLALNTHSVPWDTTRMGEEKVFLVVAYVISIPPQHHTTHLFY